MDKKIKRNWVKSLLSGEYQQGRQEFLSNNKYCCLGVLCEIAGIPIHPSPGADNYLGVYKIVGEEVASELATINDEDVPFEMIAGLIDSAL